jgi:RNA polymerase sigma-70 factor (ECF subfamily)
LAGDGAGKLTRPAEPSARAAAERAARESYGRLVAFLAARTRDIAGAEDALADAFTSALEQWPLSGVPARPEAWLFAVARRRQIDAIRRRQTAEAAKGHVAMIDDERAAVDAGETFPDERLKLMFACAHPDVEPSMRAPLILQTLLGLDAAVIGAAFLVTPSAMGQRLVRAKARIRQAEIPFRIPDRPELPERLDAVLAAIYAAFSQGWSAAAGADLRLSGLAGEAIWLARMLQALMPSEPEVRGLLALLLFADARAAARRDAAGGYVPLAAQDVALWDGDLIDEAEANLRAASGLRRIGRYQLEAAVQSAHCVRRNGAAVDWDAVRLL